MDKGRAQSTAITAPSSNSRLTRSSSSSSRNVRNKNNIGEEEGGEKGGQQLNRVDDEENQRNGCPASPPSNKKSKYPFCSRTRSFGLSPAAGSSSSPRRKKRENNSNNNNSYNSYNNNLLSSPVFAPTLSLPSPNNVSRSTALSNTASSNESSKVGAAKSSAATALSNVSTNALSSSYNNNSNANSSSNNNDYIEEVCIEDGSNIEEGWGKRVTKPRKISMTKKMISMMKKVRKEREAASATQPTLQSISEGSNKVITKKFSSKRKEELSLLSSAVDYSRAVAPIGNEQPSKSLIESLDKPTAQEQMKNRVIVNEPSLLGYIEATFVLLINPNTGNVVKKLSSIGFTSHGKEYNDRDKSADGVLGSFDVPSHPDEVPKEWLQQQTTGGSYRIRITIDYLKWIQNNPDARLRHTLQCRVVNREVYVTTPEVDAAREAEYDELMTSAQAIMDKSNPNKSNGKVEVHNAVECDDDYDGQTFQAGETTYCRGDHHLHTYDSITEFIGTSQRPMSVHCSNWNRDTEGHSTGRPTEYDIILRTGKGTKTNKFKYRAVPSGKIFKEYESGFLWKAKNGTYVWVRYLP